MVINHEWRMRLVALGLLAIPITTAAWSWATDGLMHVLLSTEITADDKLDHVRELFHAWGPAAPLVYFVFVMVEVVIAPIPGAMLYAPGGVIFGGFVGGTLSLLGNVAGAGLSCLLVRWVGGSRLTHWFEQGKLRETGRLIEKHGLWIVLLLRLNPLTSSDLVSYAAGFTNIRVWRVMVGTLIGMAPLCYLQAWFAAELVSRFPWLIYPGIVLCVAYVFVVVAVVVRMRTGPPTNRPEAVEA